MCAMVRMTPRFYFIISYYDVKKRRSKFDEISLLLNLNPTTAKVLRLLIEARKRGKGLTSEQISTRLNLPQSNIVYHLNKLMVGGLVVRMGRVYFLRGPTLKDTFDEVEQDIQRYFKHLKQLAEGL